MYTRPLQPVSTWVRSQRADGRSPSTSAVSYGTSFCPFDGLNTMPASSPQMGVHTDRRTSLKGRKPSRR